MSQKRLSLLETSSTLLSADSKIAMLLSKLRLRLILLKDQAQQLLNQRKLKMLRTLTTGPQVTVTMFHHSTRTKKNMLLKDLPLKTSPKLLLLKDLAQQLLNQRKLKMPKT
jgi:hypothetical protein